MRLRIDTDKCVGTTETVKLLRSADGKVIPAQFQFAGGAVIRAVELKERYSEEDGALSHGSYRIEVLKAGEKEPNVLKERAELFLICPSPDRKYAIIHGVPGGKKRGAPESKDNSNVFFVVDAKGDVVAEIDRSRSP